MLNNTTLNKVSDKIKMIIGIEKFDDTKILIDTYDKLSNDIILKNAVIFITGIINNGDKFYQQIFLEKALVA